MVLNVLMVLKMNMFSSKTIFHSERSAEMPDNHTLVLTKTLVDN